MARILVVDDSAFQRKRILGMVERLGHETIEASGGTEALEVILVQPPDCVFLDLLMARLGGIETLRQLRQRGSKIPVIVMTADMQETIQRQCLELGAVDVLHKPPRFEDIEAALGKHVAEGDGDAMRLTATQTDVLQELVNIGVGKAAGMLHDMTRSPIELNVPIVKVVTPRELKVEMARGTKGQVVAVQMPFTGPFAGVAQIIFASQTATEIITLTTALLSDEERKVFDVAAVREETLTEIGNVAATGVMDSIGGVLGKPFKLFPPHFVEESIENLLDKDYPNPAAEVLFVQTGIKIADRKIEGQIRVLVEVVGFRELTEALDALAAEPGCTPPAYDGLHDQAPTTSACSWTRTMTEPVPRMQTGALRKRTNRPTAASWLAERSRGS